MSLSSVSSANSILAAFSSVSRSRSPLVREVPSVSTAKPAESTGEIKDELTLSDEASRRAAPADKGAPQREASATVPDLTEEELEQVEALQERDREVRTHEQAHKSAAGPYARGGPTYEYQRGPDGQSYAVGGEVQIDTSPVEGDPEATIRKAQIVRAAALAPAEPSSQDRKVAAQATRMQAEAQAQLLAENGLPAQQEDPSSSQAPTSPSTSSGKAATAAYARTMASQGAAARPSSTAGQFLNLLA